MDKTPGNAIVDLENRFWQAIVDKDIKGAQALLHEPAVMVSGHGAMQFDHAGYRKMAEQGSMMLKAFKLTDMQVVFPNEYTAVLTYKVKQDIQTRGQAASETQEMADTSTWVRKGEDWRCVMHTETPLIRPPPRS